MYFSENCGKIYGGKASKSMEYISAKEASEKWGISERRIQKLCEENRIDGTEKFGRAWMIPKDAEKPVDGRMKTRNKQEENHGI